MSKPQVLIVEDDDLQYEIYEDCLDRFELRRAVTGSEALASAAKHPPHLIILDHVLAEGQLGLDYLPELKELLPFVPIIVVSGALEVHQKIHALQGARRAHFCITKPVDVQDLVRTVQTALEDCGEQEVIRGFEALERSKRVDAESLFSRSTDRLSRQTEIRHSLGGKKVRPNISALSRQHRVSRRTILRDLSELIRRGELDASIYPKEEGGEE